MSNHLSAAHLALCILLCGARQAQALVVPHPLFSSHAVLQRDAEVHVWGTADEGEMVTVTFAGQSASTVTSGGKWLVRLKPMKASATPQTLTISGSNTITSEDMLIGEVWICSGQSNMAWPISKSTDGPAVAAKIDAPHIRVLKDATASSGEPLETFRARWMPCDPKTALEFSAVAYYFGHDLQKALDVPIGLIGSYVGGTAADKWISEKSLLANPWLKDLITRQKQAEAAYDPEKAGVSFEAAQANHQQSIVAGKKEGELKGFTIAGADGKFVPAAAVCGNIVEVSSPTVRSPVAVRYGRANTPGVNLFNKEGLPAVPFRSDSPKGKN